PRYQGPRYEEPRYEEPRYQEPRYEAPRYEEPTHREPAYREPATARNGHGRSDPLSDPLSDPFDGMRYEPPVLRVIDGAGNRDAPPPPMARPTLAPPLVPVPEPPAADPGDGDLLIFAQMRSAWFSQVDEQAPAEEAPRWGGFADEGWQVAERLARPAVGADTR